MDKYLFQNYFELQRRQMLEDNCYAKENRTYMKDFTEEEMAYMKDNFIADTLQLATMAEELAKIKAEYAEKMKPIAKRVQNLLTDVKLGSRQVTEQVFQFDDQEEGIMGSYNGEGELVATRKLLPNERQLKIRGTGTQG
jgi:hypothetical protein